MKKYIQFFFVSLYLFGYTNLQEVTKIGLLVEHYQEHSKNNGLGFFEFLKTHYSLETYLDDDYEKDMSLPFKTTNVYKLGNTFHFVIPEKMEECLPLTKEIRKEKKKIDYQSVYYLLTQHKNVFQPPELISIEEISAN